MTSATKNAPGRCANTAEGQDLTTNHEEGAQSVSSVTRECRYCTVPVEGGADVCTFCTYYTPPAADTDNQLATLGHMVGEFATITANAAGRIPDDAPIWASVDATTAVAHLRAAARLLAQAATR